MDPEAGLVDLAEREVCRYVIPGTVTFTPNRGSGVYRASVAVVNFAMIPDRSSVTVTEIDNHLLEVNKIFFDGHGGPIRGAACVSSQTVVRGIQDRDQIEQDPASYYGGWEFTFLLV